MKPWFMSCLCLALLFALAGPGAVAQDTTFGTAYYEFECGGDGANAGGVNLPEDAHAWWTANSPAGGGTPYTTDDVYRAATFGSQEWIYEFDLPDDVQNVVLRMEAHQSVQVSITGPQNVDSGNHQTFNNGAVVFQQAGMSFTPVSVDLTSYLSNPEVQNAGNVIYLKFEGYDDGDGGTNNDALVFHVRLDNGFPGFTPGAHNKQYDESVFFKANSGSGLTGEGYRYTDLTDYVIYELDLLDSLSEAWLQVRTYSQYSLSLSTSTGGPWTEFASSPIGNANNLNTVVTDLSGYLAGNASNKVYLLLKDAGSADGWGGVITRVLVTEKDPRADTENLTFGSAFTEFEMGGDNSKAYATTNAPESYHAWWLANSLDGNGTPYTAPAVDVYRAANASQQWTYEFDLPDSATEAYLRVAGHQGLEISVAGAGGVDAGNRQTFTGASVYTGSSLSHTPLTADLSSALGGDNKLYVQFKAYDGQDALAFHARVDNGWPAFTPGPFSNRFSDEVFYLNGSSSSVDQGWRQVQDGQFTIYLLDLPDAATSAAITVDVEQQYGISVSKASSGPWTEIAVDRAVSGNRAAHKLNVSSMLTDNASNVIYLLFTDAQGDDANLGAKWYSVKVTEEDVAPIVSFSTVNLMYTDGSGYEVDVEQGGQPTTQTLTVTNTGDASLLIRDVNLTGTDAASFSVTQAPAIPLMLAPGASADIVVQFDPQVAERTLNLSAALEFVSTDPGSPTASVTLTGDAVPTELSGFEIQ